MNCFSHKVRRGAQGFTLLELLVVLALIAFFASISLVIGSRSSERAALKRDVSLFATTARRARAEALSLGAPLDLIIDAGARTYDAGAAGRGSLTSGRIAELVTARELMSETSRGVIRFYPDGSTSGGRVVIIGDSARNTIVIDWLSGGVSLEREIER